MRAVPVWGARATVSAAAPEPDDLLDDGVNELDARAAERLAHPIRLQKLQAVPTAEVKK